MDKDELKKRIFAAIDRRADEIIGLGEKIRSHPELGFKEVKTARVVEETFGRLGLQPDRKSTRLNSSHLKLSRMPSSA